MTRTFQVMKLVLATFWACLMVVVLGDAAKADQSIPQKGGDTNYTAPIGESPGADDSVPTNDGDPCNGFDLYVEIFTTLENDYLVFQGECVRDRAGNVVEIKQSFDVTVDYNVSRKVKTVLNQRSPWKRYQRVWVTTTSVSWAAKTHELTAPTVRYHSPVRKGGEGDYKVVSIANGPRPTSMTITFYGKIGKIGEPPMWPAAT